MKINLIDVGSEGVLPKQLKENENKIDKILSFDPILKKSNKEKLIYNYALWNKKCNKWLNIFNSPESSSLFLQNYDYIGKHYFELINERGYKPQVDSWFKRSLWKNRIKVKCNTLDNVLNNLNINFHFLKLDTQGSEFQVLQGANNFLLNNCIGIQAELFNIPMYKNIKLKREIIEYILSYDFRILKHLSTGSTFLSQDEYVFIRNEDTEYTRLIKGIYK